MRCPAEHPEQFLVLLPDTMAERSVVSGRLGCPVCGRTYLVVDGVAHFDAPPTLGVPDSVLTAAAAEALVGLSGPGGFVVLVGVTGGLSRGLVERLEGVHIVSVNPPDSPRETPAISILEAPSIPLKAHSVRGVILAPGYASDARWLVEARRVVLPGLRVIGEGPDPAIDGIEIIASAGGVWVGLAS